jgi:hypothetical protein
MRAINEPYFSDELNFSMTDSENALELDYKFVEIFCSERPRPEKSVLLTALRAVEYSV